MLTLLLSSTNTIWHEVKTDFSFIENKTHEENLCSVTCVTNLGHKHYLRQITFTIFKGTLMQIGKSANTVALI